MHRISRHSVESITCYLLIVFVLLQIHPCSTLPAYSLQSNGSPNPSVTVGAVYDSAPSGERPQRHWSPSRNRGQVERVSEGVYRGLLEGVSGCGDWSIPVDSGRWRAQAGGESVVQPDIQGSIQTSVVPLGRSYIGPVAEFATSLLDDEWEQRDELEEVVRGDAWALCETPRAPAGRRPPEPSDESGR
jgi:hypothetical protein